MPIRPAELRDLSPFAALPRNERASVAHAATDRTFRSGETIFRAHEPCSDLITVHDGFVRLYQIMPDNTEITTSIATPGALLTAAALQIAAQHDAFAEALGPVRTVEVPSMIVNSLTARYPAFVNEVINHLRRQANGLYADTAVNAALPLPERILHVLRTLTPDHSGRHASEEMRQLALRISHERLACLIHSDRTSVTRSLRVLEQQGQIRRGHGHVTHVRAALAKTTVGA
jgi:CRP/FNR family cyclic AMP-dependent transcriptional regulator